MDSIKKKIVIIGTALVLFFGALIAAKLGVFEKGNGKIEGLKEAATTVGDLEIPEEAVVVGVGEATHGNAEFQELKLSVLKRLGSEGTCRAILFEMPVADGDMLNAYVHGEGDVASAEDAVGQLMYPLYDTKQMAALLDWMKTENEGKDFDDTYCIFGIDPQGADEPDPDAPSFEEDPNAYSDYRDDKMLENLKNILADEKERGYNRVMVTAHNGHLCKGNSDGFGSITFGQKLYDEFGEGYFVIGSDFYNANVNINTAGKYGDEYERANHEFCSSDPLAMHAKDFNGEVYALDFTKITDEDSELYKTVHSEMFMGLIGEGFNENWYTYKSYRAKVVPADKYDAVVYYYEANPIEPIHH